MKILNPVTGSPMGIMDDPQVYIAEENPTTGITYICFDDSSTREIHRITKNVANNITTTTVEKAFGSWTNRASLTYVPINKPEA